LQEADVWRDGDLGECAVHAIADAEVAFERLDMDVRGAFADGLAEDLIHEAHDRGFLVVFEHGDFLAECVGFGVAVFFVDEVRRSAPRRRRNRCAVPP